MNPTPDYFVSLSRSRQKTRLSVLGIFFLSASGFLAIQFKNSIFSDRATWCEVFLLAFLLLLFFCIMISEKTLNYVAFVEYLQFVTGNILNLCHSQMLEQQLLVLNFQWHRFRVNHRRLISLFSVRSPLQSDV